MSLEESNRMLRKIHSQGFNSENIEAKKCDDFIFENRDFDDNSIFDCLNRGRRLSPMPKNELNKEELKVRIYKLKGRVDEEPDSVWQGEKDLAHKYLNWVLDIIDEYRY